MLQNFPGTTRGRVNHLPAIETITHATHVAVRHPVIAGGVPSEIFWQFSNGKRALTCNYEFQTIRDGAYHAHDTLASSGEDTRDARDHDPHLEMRDSLKKNRYFRGEGIETPHPFIFLHHWSSQATCRGRFVREHERTDSRSCPDSIQTRTRHLRAYRMKAKAYILTYT